MKDNWREAKKFLNVFQQAYLAADKHDSWGKGNFHLSDAADCTRKIWYRIMMDKFPELKTTLGYIEPEASIDMQMNLSIGHGLHEQLQTAFVKKMKWCNDADVEIPLVIPELCLKGSVDLVVPVEAVLRSANELGITNLPALTGTHIVIDIKSKRDDVVKISKPGRPTERTHSFPDKVMKYPDDKYYIQIQSYMKLLPELYPERYPEINLGLFLYVCKNDGRTLVVACEKDEEAGNIVKAKAAKMKTSIEEKIAPPREYTKSNNACKGWPTIMDNGSTEMKYGCPYYDICWR